MRHGRVLLLSVFLITIVSSINIVDARRSPAAKKKTATLTPESFLDSDQDFGIEVRSDYGGLGGPLAASSWLPGGTAGKNLAKAVTDARREAGYAAYIAGNYPKIGDTVTVPNPFDKTINALLKEIPEDNKELLQKIGKIDGLELTYDKTIDKFYYVINTQGKTAAQIKETIRLVNQVLSTP